MLMYRIAMPTARSSFTNTRDLGQGVHEGLDLGYLRPDMLVDADDLDVREGFCRLVILERLLDGNAEFVLFEARGDVRVGPGIDVRIHAQGDPRLRMHVLGRAVDGLQLLAGLHIEHEDVHLERILDLVPPLADAGVHDLLGIDPGAKRPEQLAAGDDVGAGALPANDPEDRRAGVRLHGEADEVRHSGVCLIKGAEMVRQRAAAVAIEGRPHALGDRPDRNAFAVELSILVLEIVHIVT